MLALDLYLTYIAACFLVSAVPGPNVTVVISNSLTYGTRAGLLTVAGSQLGLAILMAVVILGLSTIVEVVGQWFDWLRIAGAVYLAWLGWQLLKSPSKSGPSVSIPPSGRSHFVQGLLVMLSNPKALFFFGAFIPQFIDSNGPYVSQAVVLGIAAMAVGLITDGGYAVLSGHAGRFLSRYIRLISQLSGGLLIGGAIWLALARPR
jgi:homoserine/homoserine lactone efflux protein